MVDAIVSDEKISTFDKRPGDMTLEVRERESRGNSMLPVQCHGHSIMLCWW